MLQSMNIAYLKSQILKFSYQSDNCNDNHMIGCYCQIVLIVLNL